MARWQFGHNMRHRNGLTRPCGDGPIYGTTVGGAALREARMSGSVSSAP